MRVPVPGQQPTLEEQQPSPEENKDDNSSDDDHHNWSPPTTDEEHELMPARGPVQAALLKSFEQHHDRRDGDCSIEEINAALE